MEAGEDQEVNSDLADETPAVDDGPEMILYLKKSLTRLPAAESLKMAELKKKPEDSGGNLNIEYPVMPTVNELVHDNYFEFVQKCCDNACDKLNNALLFNIRNNIPRKYFETNFTAKLQVREKKYDTTSSEKVSVAEKNVQSAVEELMAKMDNVEGCPMLQAGAKYWEHGDMTKSRVVRIGVRDPPMPAAEDLITNSHLYNVV